MRERPGEYVPGSTEGITRVEDLPRPLTLAGDDLRLAEALCYRGRQLDVARIDQGGRPVIRNVAEADPGFGVGSPQRASAARVAE